MYLSTLAVAALGYTLYVTTSEQASASAVEAALAEPIPPPTGSVPPGTAAALVEANKDDVERCAQVAKMLDVNATAVTLRVHLSATGGVGRVSGAGTDEILLLCFRRFAKEWTWPVPNGGPTTVVVRIPLAESPAGPVVAPDPAKAAPPKKPRSRRRTR